MKSRNTENKTGRRYVRLFDDPQNVQSATEMLNDGVSFSMIGKILGCDHSSVMSFYKRQQDKGFVFTRPKRVLVEKVRINKNDEVVVNEVEYAKERRPLYNYTYKFTSNYRSGSGESCLEKAEVINKGKNSYKEYLSVYNKKLKKAQAERLLKAKQTIEELNKTRVFFKDLPFDDY